MSAHLTSKLPHAKTQENGTM